MMELLPITIPLALLFLGWLTGTMLESNHYRSIRKREATFSRIPAFNNRTFPYEKDLVYARLCLGSVVISVDYFKQFRAGLRKIFGGELHSFSSLIDRARREAILRMKESSPNADLFLNVKLETSTIASGMQKQLGTIEVVAYGTAIKFKQTVR